MIAYFIFLLFIFILKLLSEAQFIWDKGYERVGKSNHIFINKYCKMILNNRNSILYYFMILIVIFFSAARYGVGWDFWAYHDTIKLNLITNIVLNDEWITIFLVELSKAFHQPQIYFAVNSAVSISLIAVTCKRYSKDHWLSMIFFITFPLFYLNSFSVVRNFTAIAVTFYGIRFIKEKKLIKYIIIVLIAGMIHRTALFALAFYFVKDIKLNATKLFIALFSIPIIRIGFAVMIKKLLPQYIMYLSSTTKQEGTKAIYVFMIITVVFILFHRYIRENQVNLYFKYLFIGVCIYLMFYDTGTLGHRLSLYGTLFSLLVLPEIIYMFQSQKDRIILKYILYLFCVLMFYYTLSVGRAAYIPYRFFF